MNLSAKVVAVTKPIIDIANPSMEGLIAYCARVSNPSHQDRLDNVGLLQYCINNKHWSVFEMGNIIVEVEAARDITRQLLRHRSFSFQEFSQRYSDQIKFTSREPRRQDTKNRQNSIDDVPQYDKTVYGAFISNTLAKAQLYYKAMREMGVAKECARVILPEGLTMSKLYVNGTVRSWLHYLDVRDDEGVTQWEHVLLAREIKKAIQPHIPTIIGVE